MPNGRMQCVLAIGKVRQMGYTFAAELIDIDAHLHGTGNHIGKCDFIPGRVGKYPDLAR